MELIRNGMSGLEVREILNTAIETIDKGIEINGSASVADRYVDAITADGHKLTITRKTLPDITVTEESIKGDDGEADEEITFISGISAQGHTLNVIKTPFPQGSGGMEHKTFLWATDFLAFLEGEKDGTDWIAKGANICTWQINERFGINTSGIMSVVKTGNDLRQLLYCCGDPEKDFGTGDYSLFARNAKIESGKITWATWSDIFNKRFADLEIRIRLLENKVL
jgi:hypothetical protein